MLDLKTEVISNSKIKGRYFRCVFRAPGLARSARPGQFINIRVSEGTQPLLRRPFGVHRAKGSNIEIVYEVLGKGTKILSQKKPGEYLDVIGPLGNGFDLRRAIGAGRQAILVSGGIGVAPLLFLAEKLAATRPIVLIGSKTKSQIICEKEFKDLGCDVKISTDDGTRGLKGYVSDLLSRVLWLTNNQARLAIYACGPKPMLKEISRLCARPNVDAQISLEEHMACGIGACLGCVINTVSGYQRVCKEGPVFEANQVIW